MLKRGQTGPAARSPNANGEPPRPRTVPGCSVFGFDLWRVYAAARSRRHRDVQTRLEHPGEADAAGARCHADPAADPGGLADEDDERDGKPEVARQPGRGAALTVSAITGTSASGCDPVSGRRFSTQPSRLAHRIHARPIPASATMRITNATAKAAAARPLACRRVGLSWLASAHRAHARRSRRGVPCRVAARPPDAAVGCRKGCREPTTLRRSPACCAADSDRHQHECAPGHWSPQVRPVGRCAYVSVD